MLGALISALLGLLSCATCTATWLAVNLGLPFAFLLFIMAGYNSLSMGRCTSRRRLDGKIAIVTGANSGIGLETAKDLAMRGAKVILACRNQGRAEYARGEIIRDTGAPEENLVVKILDLASLASVRKFASDILETVPQIDILVNNAGLAHTGPRKNTEDGLEYGMACNHYGHFLLTHLLLDLLKKSPAARIVNVSSLAHIGGDISLSSLQDRAREGWVLYSDSKLANIVFSQELAKRLPQNVTVNSLHPGAVATNFLQNADMNANSKERIFSFFKIFSHPVFRVFKTSFEGAQTTIHLAVSDEVKGVTGKYFSDCKEAGVWNRQAHSPEIGRQFWEHSGRVTGVSGKQD